MDYSGTFRKSRPFNHVVIDDFLDIDFAKNLEESFFAYDSPKWHSYSNSIEEKKTCNIWNEFNEHLYMYFSEINSTRFVKRLSEFTGLDLIPDNGLHGGGLHIHSAGGNLNPHLDYSIHPKLKLQRKINIIYYCSSDMELLDGDYGSLGLWENSHDVPGKLMKSIKPSFNRAVIFDTSQKSWHGLVKPLPDNSSMLRKSLATYYLCQPSESADTRSRALFSPRDNQTNDADVLETIERRSDENSYSDVYVVDDKK